MFLSDARKPSLLNHLTSVFIVHLSVLVVSDLCNDCNRKNIQLFFPFFTMTQHPSPLRGMTTIFRESVQSFNVSSMAEIFESAVREKPLLSYLQGSHPQVFLLRTLRVPPSTDTANVSQVLLWGREFAFLQKSSKPVLQISPII